MSLESTLVGILKKYPTRHNREAVEHILEAHRKLVEFELGLGWCGSTEIAEEDFRGLYNEFRRGRLEV